LHLVCVRDARVTFFPGAHLGGGKTVEVRVESDSSEREDEEGNQLELLGVELLESYLDLKDNAKDRFLSWVAFSAEGERLFDADSFDEQLLRDHGLVVVLEGGVWRWPGVRVGFQRRIELSEENRTLTLETLSLSPLVLASAGFLSESECTEIQRLAEPIVRYSEVSLMDKDAGRPSSDFRTSSSAFLTRASASPLLRSLNDRTAAFLRIPRTHQEHLQVLRYFPGEKYDQHHDYFDPELYQNDLATLTLTRHGKRNRFATFFWYLSNVASGGETSFPKVEGRSPLSLLDCAGTDSLLVRPELGKVVLFYSMTAAGELDPLSVHAACPVGPGGDVKWAANKWVWNAPMTYIQ
jgi:prolyl 4-hydroxylase